MLLLTRPQGAGRAPSPAPGLPEAAFHLPPQVPQFQAPEGGWHCLQVRGAPPQETYPHSPQCPQGTALFQGPCIYTTNQAPKKLPHLLKAEPTVQVAPYPSPRWENSINFLSNVLKPFNCWNEKVSHETQHLALRKEGKETLEPRRPQRESDAGGLSSLRAGLPGRSPLRHTLTLLPPHSQYVCTPSVQAHACQLPSGARGVYSCVTHVMAASLLAHAPPSHPHALAGYIFKPV